MCAHDVCVVCVCCVHCVRDSKEGAEAVGWCDSQAIALSLTTHYSHSQQQAIRRTTGAELRALPRRLEP